MAGPYEYNLFPFLRVQMQTSGTSCDAKEDTISDVGRPHGVKFNSLNCGRPDCASYSLGYIWRTTLTERVVEFLERYN